jgi:uncharacterized membrane protein
MPHPTKPPSSKDLAPVVERNIQALLARRSEAERTRSLSVRISDNITRFTGSMPFVVLHVIVFGIWITMNLPFTPVPKFDPSFVVLAMVASVEAIFLSTFVLISQNRMAALADQRADLDLQVSLLAEHEITRLVQLTDAIAHKLGVPGAGAPDLEPLKRDVHPEEVLDQIERSDARPPPN